MNELKLLLLKIKLNRLEKEYNQTKTNKIQLLDEIIKTTTQIESIQNTDFMAIKKKKNAYETKKWHYDNLNFDRCRVFNALSSLIKLSGEEYALTTFEYTDERDGRVSSGREEYQARKIEFCILSRREVRDIINERYKDGKLASTTQAKHIIDRLIKEGETFFVFLSDEMHFLPDSITNCPQYEINTTHVEQKPIVLYEPNGTSKSELVRFIKDYAKEKSTDFDIPLLIEKYRNRANKKLEK